MHNDQKNKLLASLDDRYLVGNNLEKGGEYGAVSYDWRRHRRARRMTTRAILVRETLISIAINVAITIAFFFAMFGLSAPIVGSSFGIDFLPQAFFVSLMGTIIPGLLIRRGTGTAIAPVVLRSAALALASLALAGGGAWLIFSQFAAVPAGIALAIKIAFAAILSAIVTPYAVHRAMTAPIRKSS